MTPEEAHFALLACLQPPSTQPSLRTETSTVPYAVSNNFTIIMVAAIAEKDTFSFVFRALHLDLPFNSLSHWDSRVPTIGFACCILDSLVR